MVRHGNLAIVISVFSLAIVVLPFTASGAIDVTAVGAIAAADSNNVVVVHVDVPPTGTGLINPFLRIHHTDSEQGYNTDYRAAGNPSTNLLDDGTDTNFTQAITLGEIREVSLDTDGNGSLDTPTPSCTTLSSSAHTFDSYWTDDVMWGCAPVF